MRRTWWIALVLAVALVGAACSDSGGSDETDESTDAAEPETEEPGASEADDEEAESLGYQDTIDLSFEDVQGFWTDELPVVYDGLDWQLLRERSVYPMTPDSGSVEIVTGPLGKAGPCAQYVVKYDRGPFAAVDNAYYEGLCDIIAYDDAGIMPELFEEHGNYALALVIAHEFGHRVTRHTLSLREMNESARVIDKEQQADCYAGAWTGYVDSGESDLLILEPGDLDAGIAGYLGISDDPRSPLPPDHGTAFDRINAFQEGFEQGPARCAEYIDEDGAPFNAPPVLDLEFDEPDDTGDVSLNQAIRFTEELLDAYWPLAYGEYEPIDEQVSYEIDDPDEVDADDLEDAACGDEEPDPEALDDAIFYCEEENFVGWDEDLLEEAYDDTGDFGVATVIGEQYAHAVANQQGVTGEDLAVNLYADCLNGSWTGAIYNNALDVDVVLSPGDLDEAVQSLLAFRDDVAVETPERGSAFQRVQAFRTGFFEGPNACNRVLAGEGS